MYTQCRHCKAIFRVTMKELTAAQGLLRCGECDTIFDAMKALSTTLPEERRFAQGSATPADIPDYAAIADDRAAHEQAPWLTRFKSFIQRFRLTGQSKKQPQRNAKTASLHRVAGSNGFLLVGVAILGFLLLLQVLYTGRNWLAQQPLTAVATQQACHWLGCALQVPRDVRRIDLLSRNVYSHPNTPGVLTISISIQNNASFAQPYPLIEISFLTKNNEIMALRRFTPDEYLKDFTQGTMPVAEPQELLLNIEDPGMEAVSFKFRFM